MFKAAILRELLPKTRYEGNPWLYRFLEKNLPAYSLPNPLICQNDLPVNDKQTWWTIRRPEILELFSTQVYGRSPPVTSKIQYEITSKEDNALNGIAIRKEITIHLLGNYEDPQLHVLLYIPKHQNKPTPAFIGLNIVGNHTTSLDPGITIHNFWIINQKSYSISHNSIAEAPRGAQAERWPYEYILQRGYAVATAYYGEIVPDSRDGLMKGLPRYFHTASESSRSPEEWGAVGAWAWGLSRIMDYLQIDSDIDPKRVMVTGQSRLGKTALWAGAQDQRFAIVFSNCSGCTGALIARRKLGETIQITNFLFPYWFCLNYRQYNEKENKLPIDQHLLLALIAPRPLYVASADRDLWADPMGEYLTLKAADPVYKLLGTPGLIGPERPEVEHPITGILGHHIRRGFHNILLYDWEQYCNFADFNFNR
jgi:hypothetical protein